MDRSRIAVPALWGGVECTLARVGPRYVDQTRLTGHDARADDIERIRSLGVKAVRYPVLWERVAPCGLERADWSWTDERLAMLRESGIEPVVTLLHHGSGPPHTSLLDPSFPQQFAAYARAVAERYPWLRYFTPVNEPLTTARFCALYGVWYPHAADDRAFVTALQHELIATKRAMDAIRSVVPDALLVQTEDLAYISSTPRLAYQAELENERRFASFDLLCGRVDRTSRFFQWALLRGLALDDRSLEAMRCPPDILGCNYYVTSERFLDHRIDAYPGITAGGNDRERYVDVEAVRVSPEGLMGFARLGRQVWERYHRPMAVTEAHLGAAQDEQVRWLQERYDETLELAAEGVDVRAFTVWSLFGACDWDSLLTQERGSYEPGAFDVSAGGVRETLVAQWMRATARSERFGHEALDLPGWWRKPERMLYYPESGRPAGTSLPSAS